jgi:hypothetical protein
MFVPVFDSVGRRRSGSPTTSHLRKEYIMSRSYHHGHGGGGIESAAGGLLALALFIAFLLAIVIIAATVFITKTFWRYHKVSKALWRSLWIGLGLVVIGVLLSLINHDFATVSSALWMCAFLQLFVVSVVVNREHSQTLMKPSINVVEELRNNAFWRNSDAKTRRIA